MVEQATNLNNHLPEDLLSPERRKTAPVTVISGGVSSERPGSIKSGKTVVDLLTKAGYSQVRSLDVTPDTILNLTDRRAVGVAFTTLHGGYGEDGRVQGLLEMLDIPYTGSGVAASAISADKVLFSRAIRGFGYRSADQIVVNRAAELEAMDIIYPKVLKPATQGCSYGVFFVRNRDQLLERAPLTGQFSDRIILEDYIPGRELTVGIFEDPRSTNPHVLPITENVLAREILDFEAKIAGGEHLYQVVLPAELDSPTQGRIEAACADVFQKLNCRGYVRMDLRLTKEGEIYFLENNTNPGMLSLQESDFPKMLHAGGIAPTDFVDRMVEASLLNHQAKLRSQASMPSKQEMVKYFKYFQA